MDLDLNSVVRGYILNTVEDSFGLDIRQFHEAPGPAAEGFLLRCVFVHCGSKDFLNCLLAPNPSLAKLASGQLSSFKEVEAPTQGQPGEFGIGADAMKQIVC